MIVDDFFARSGKGYHVGDSIPILNHTFRICGIVEHGKGGRKFLPIKTLGALLGAENNATLFYVKTDNPDDEASGEAGNTGSSGSFRLSGANRPGGALHVDARNLPGFNIALHIVISIAVVVGFLVIFQAMYTAVLERTREIGILKSLRRVPDLHHQSCLARNRVALHGRHRLGIGATFLIKAGMSARLPTKPFPSVLDGSLRPS